MTPKISPGREFDRIVHPFNIHRLLILIGCFSFLYSYVIVFSHNSEMSIFRLRDLFQIILMIVIVPLVWALIIFGYYTVYNHFKGFPGQFEKMTAKGFKIIVIALVLEQILLGVNYYSGSLFLWFHEKFGSEAAISYQLYLNAMIGNIEIGIALVAFYGFYLVGTSLNHYEKTNIETPPGRSRRPTGHPKPVPDVFFPMDLTRIIIMVVCLAPPIGIGIILGINEAFYADTIFDVQRSNVNMLLLDQEYIKACISLLTVLIILKISRYFSYFFGQFERRLSFGFLILMVGMLMMKLKYFIHTAFYSPFIRYIAEHHRDNFQDMLSYYFISFSTADLIISLVILYGLLVIVSSLNYYRLKTRGRSGKRS